MTGGGPISLEDVQRVARLARLTLSDAEAQALTADLRSILQYVHKLDELDPAKVTPCAHAVDLPTKLRDDTVQPGLPLELGLRGAPEPLNDGFGVPKVIE